MLCVYVRMCVIIKLAEIVKRNVGINRMIL